MGREHLHVEAQDLQEDQNTRKGLTPILARGMHESVLFRLNKMNLSSGFSRLR